MGQFIIFFSHFLCSLEEINLKLTIHTTLDRIDLTKHVCYRVCQACAHVIPQNENIFFVKIGRDIACSKLTVDGLAQFSFCTIW